MDTEKESDHTRRKKIPLTDDDDEGDDFKEDKSFNKYHSNENDE